MTRTADLYLRRSDSHNQYSAYTLDPEHGWIGTHRLPLESAIKYSLDYRSRTAGGLVAVVPDGTNPDPILKAVSELGATRLTDQVLRLRDETYDLAGKALLPYGRCDTCGAPCDQNGCIRFPDHVVAFA
jgi:hypothetical protein